MHELITLYRFTLSACESLMADVAEEEMADQPSPGVNPPAWVLGHLAIATDYALELLGQAKRLPQEWHEEFGPGSEPLSQKHPYPSKVELLIALREGHSAVEAALPSADPQALAGPNPIAPLAKALPTAGDLLAHLLTTHPAMHLGHLSNWRRQKGRPPLF